jgi:hypothetical protein
MPDLRHPRHQRGGVRERSRGIQIANQGTAANPSLRGAIQSTVYGGNITGGLLTGTGRHGGEFRTGRREQ